MYLARKRIRGKIRYAIRQSVKTGDTTVSRELFDLGEDPGQYIIYPGSGPGFYFDDQLCEQLAEQGCEPDYDELESVLWQFLDPETQRVIRGFTRKAQPLSVQEQIALQVKRCETEPFHIFDMRRVHYLRFGELDQSRIHAVPRKIYRCLLDKSRDEIEQQFMEMEQVLEAREKKNYAYVIFDVPGYFAGPLARKFPEALDHDRVDECFLDALCRLNADTGFWSDLDVTKRLNDYLIRYACWFFDTDFAGSRYLEDLMWQFKARHHAYRPPAPRSAMPLDEAASVMGISREQLSGMTVKTLTRQYREKAKAHHPDKGGGHETFIRLNRAFEQLLRTVRAPSEKPGRYTTRRG